ncbi:MAG: hypothetical protein J0L73_13890 [Verrucomicrobia bacterium]|nr:hypothetical protein [Verrucomicrobiota bacterium]
MSESLLSHLPAHYLAALRNHLEQGRQASLLPAHDLGIEALNHGMETLDLAKVHHQALDSLILPGCPPATRDEITLRAGVFFTEALVPIEKTHRLALDAGAGLKALHERLDRRTLALADCNRELSHGISQRLTAEAALEHSQRISSQLLKESRVLEQQLKEITHQILATDEQERKRMSLRLHDDIGQALLGIHVRLLALKAEVASKYEGLNHEIATTQKLVESAVNTISQFTHELGIPHEI